MKSVADFFFPIAVSSFWPSVFQFLWLTIPARVRSQVLNHGKKEWDQSQLP